jgi:hypothetical protein
MPPLQLTGSVMLPLVVVHDTNPVPAGSKSARAVEPPTTVTARIANAPLNAVICLIIGNLRAAYRSSILLIEPITDWTGMGFSTNFDF